MNNPSDNNLKRSEFDYECDLMYAMASSDTETQEAIEDLFLS